MSRSSATPGTSGSSGVVLVVAVVLHVTAAAQLSRRDRAARPTRYEHRQRWQASFATSTMRWGGIIIALFVVWHILDLTVGVVNPALHRRAARTRTWWPTSRSGGSTSSTSWPWWRSGFHINHGFRSAARTLGIERPNRARAIRFVGTGLALAISLGFIAVPVGVMTGVVH